MLSSPVPDQDPISVGDLDREVERTSLMRQARQAPRPQVDVVDLRLLGCRRDAVCLIDRVDDEVNSVLSSPEP
jgi:hypothetical protein